MEVPVLNGVLRVDMGEKVTFEQRLEGGEEMNPLAVWGRVF